MKDELEKCPDPAPMTSDEMLDIVLPIMEKQREALLEDGVDLRAFEKNMATFPF